MSCGGGEDDDLAKYKKLPRGTCKMVNLQQLPANEPTRSSFVAEKDNMFVSCDFSALESRLGADIYEEKSMLNEFLNGSGDMHSLCAKLVFHEELKDIEVKDIKKKRPDLRSKVKSIEFSQQFGGTAYAVASQMGCTLEEASVFVEAYNKGFTGISKFKEKGSRFVRNNGYVLMCEITGHKMYWWDWNQWKKRQESFTNEFWDDYKANHKNTEDAVAQMVKKHFKAASKWDRMALNAPTQGTGSCIIKDATCELFKYIVYNNLFNKVKLCALVHDEICCEYPKELENFPKTLEDIMEKSASKYCKSLPIPAEASVGLHWIH